MNLNETLKQNILDALLDLERRDITTEDFFEILEDAVIRGDKSVAKLAEQAILEGIDQHD